MARAGGAGVHGGPDTVLVCVATDALTELELPKIQGSRIPRHINWQNSHGRDGNGNLQE